MGLHVDRRAGEQWPMMECGAMLSDASFGELADLLERFGSAGVVEVLWQNPIERLSEPVEHVVSE